MLNFLEMTVINSYDDNWNLTFYIVLIISLAISFAWTIFKMNKEGKRNNNAYKVKENKIYNNVEDMIEMDVIPKRKINENNENYYDVYQNENKKQSRGVVDSKIDEEEIKNDFSENIHIDNFKNQNNNNVEKNKIKTNKKQIKNNNKTRKNNYYSSKKNKKKN